jgi:hypothetical protein
MAGSCSSRRSEPRRQHSRARARLGGIRDSARWSEALAWSAAIELALRLGDRVSPVFDQCLTSAAQFAERGGRREWGEPRGRVGVLSPRLSRSFPQTGPSWPLEGSYTPTGFSPIRPLLRASFVQGRDGNDPDFGCESGTPEFAHSLAGAFTLGCVRAIPFPVRRQRRPVGMAPPVQRRLCRSDEPPSTGVAEANLQVWSSPHDRRHALPSSHHSLPTPGLGSRPAPPVEKIQNSR